MLIMLIALVLGFAQRSAQPGTAQTLSPLGVWTNPADKTATFEIFQCGPTLSGRFASVTNDPATGKPRLDALNADPKLRRRSQAGLVFMQDFQPVGENKWEDGTLYNFDDGKTSSCLLRMEQDNELIVKGYTGFSLMGKSQNWLGKSQTWIRVRHQQPLADPFPLAPLMNQRIVAVRAGGPEQLHLLEEPLPVPRPSEVCLRVLAAGVAFGDTMLRRGKAPGAPPFPLTPGYDVVGEVEAVGRDVTGFRLGDRVAALPGRGGYTTYLCLPAADLIPVPANLKPADVVSVVLNYTTAYQLLTKAAGLRAGQSVLVHGAAGGVGTAVLQLGQLLGLTVYGTVSTSKQAIVRQYGGIPIDYTKTDFVQEIKHLTGGVGVDAVLDAVGGAQLSRSYRALGRTGTLVMFGASAATQAAGSFGLHLLGTLLRFGLLKALPDGRRVKVYTYNSKANKANEQAAALVQLLSEGKITPVVARVLPLSQASEAHRLLEQTKPVGKIVLEP